MDCAALVMESARSANLSAAARTPSTYPISVFTWSMVVWSFPIRGMTCLRISSSMRLVMLMVRASFSATTVAASMKRAKDMAQTRAAVPPNSARLPGLTGVPAAPGEVILDGRPDAVRGQV